MPLTRDNFLVTGKDGEFDGTSQADMDAMFAAMQGKSRVVVHFHGGLVNLQGGMDAATRLWADYDAAGAFPVFFVWKSGLLEIVPRNLTEIFGEDIFKILLKWVLKFAKGKIVQADGMKGLAVPLPTEIEIHTELMKAEAGKEPYEGIGSDSVSDLTASERQQFELSLVNDQDFQATVQAIADATLDHAESLEGARGIPLRTRKSVRTLMSPAVVDEIQADVRQRNAEGSRGLFSSAVAVKRALEVLAHVIKRFQSHRDHGLYPTVVEEILRMFYVANIGGSVWQAMKQETLDSFKPGATPLRGGDYFLRKLGAVLGQPGPRPAITLVGHSTGAVFIDNFLEAVDARKKAGTLPADFVIDRVLFLAPACTYAHFAATLRKYGGLIKEFRLFAMSDDRETRDVMLPVIYPRSLLYFVSGLMERDGDGQIAFDEPIVGMQRYAVSPIYDNDADVREVRAFLNGGTTRAVWSPNSGTAGAECDAFHHGDLDNDGPTIASLRFLIH